MANKVCAQCSDSNCYTCITTPNNCTRCFPLYYRNGSTCYPCAAGQYSDGMNPCAACGAASPNCSLCSSYSACAACKTLYKYDNTTSCTPCNPGEWSDGQPGSVCTLCTSNCATCKSTTTCATCASGYGNSAGKCSLCLSNQYSNGS